jgi:hypothetical protein
MEYQEFSTYRPAFVFGDMLQKFHPAENPNPEEEVKSLKLDCGIPATTATLKLSEVGSAA